MHHLPDMVDHIAYSSPSANPTMDGLVGEQGRVDEAA